MPISLSSINQIGLETQWYKVSNFGFTSVRVTESAPAYFHTFSGTQIPATVFFPDLQNLESGDFNGDGHTDVAITWSYWAHFFQRSDENLARTRLFFNDGKGNLVSNNTLFSITASRGGNLYNESAVADFNGDGKDDVVSAPAGLTGIGANSSFIAEPIALLLSGTNGVFFDATTNIGGQESGSAISGFWAHDISTGDFDKDGDVDFFSRNALFLNDGKGRFSNASNQLPANIADNSILRLASTAADFNGDGFDDLAVFAAGRNLISTTVAGYLMLSGGSANISQRAVTTLPHGPIGAADEIIRDAITGDIDRDGDIDIVVLASRDSGPGFNRGVSLQILENNGSGTFTDVSKARIDNSRLMDLTASGGDTATTAYGGSDVRLIDWNGDGHLDLFVTSGKGPSHGDRPLLNLFENDGTGRFTWKELDMLARVENKNIQGLEKNAAGPPLRQTGIADLNGDRMVDFISVIETQRSNFATDPEELTAYTILSKGVYGTGPAGLDGASVGAPGFNESYYLNTNPSAAAAVAQGAFTTGLAHYQAIGKAAGLKIFAPGTHVYGASGNDVIVLREGNERADGGAGIDTVVFSGNRSAYTVTNKNNLISVSGVSSKDELISIERLNFSDKKLTFDLDGNPGLVARTLGLVLGKSAVYNQQYMGLGIDALDNGMSQKDLMQIALQTVLGPAADNKAVVNLIFRNLTGSDADSANLSYFLGILDSGAMSRADLGVLAANHSLTANLIDLVGFAATGIEYI